LRQVYIVSDNNYYLLNKTNNILNCVTNSLTNKQKKEFEKIKSTIEDKSRGDLKDHYFKFILGDRKRCY
jgi:hypothetical protein